MRPNKSTTDCTDHTDALDPRSVLSVPSEQSVVTLRFVAQADIYQHSPFTDCGIPLATFLKLLLSGLARPPVRKTSASSDLAGSRRRRPEAGSPIPVAVPRRPGQFALRPGGRFGQGARGPDSAGPC
jgi:hypothetical protein